jgi:hypothetical protein
MRKNGMMSFFISVVFILNLFVPCLYSTRCYISLRFIVIIFTKCSLQKCRYQYNYVCILFYLLIINPIKYKQWITYVPLVVNTPRSFPHSWLITGFVARLIRRVPLVEQELLTLPEHLSSPSVFSGVRKFRILSPIFVGNFFL